MAQNIIDTKIREAYDTEANWIKYNPVLLSGQLAYSSDKYGKYKIGNGASRWSQLQYATLGWGDITEKPSTFSPSTHTHNASQITDIRNASVKYATTAGAANAVAWDNVSGKPTSMKNPYALTLTSSNHFKSIQYDGSSAQTFMISSDLLYGASDNPIASASENSNKNTRYVKLLDVTCNAVWRRINQQFIVALRHASFLLNIHIASTESMKFSTNDISYIPLSSNNNIEITRFLAGIVHVDSTKDRFELWYKQDQWTSSVGVIPIGRSAETVDVYLNGYHTDTSGNITTKPVFATDISIKNNMPVLYNNTGNLVNGTMTQQAITNALATKALKEHTHPVSQITGLTPSAIGAAASDHTHTLVEQAALADKATYINDANDSRPISISYVNETSTSTRFPVWGDRNTMVSMSPENLRTSINAAKTDHTHPTGNTTTLGLTKLYTKTGTAIDGTITQKGITEAIDSLKYLCAPIGHTHTVSQITDFPNIKAITNTQIDSLASL